MIEIGNKIECYRGETFDYSKSYKTVDGEPLYIPSGLQHPYAVFNVKSNVYDMKGRYSEKHWLDLSGYTQYDGIVQFLNNEIPASANPVVYDVYNTLEVKDINATVVPTTSTSRVSRKTNNMVEISIYDNSTTGVVGFSWRFNFGKVNNLDKVSIDIKKITALTQLTASLHLLSDSTPTMIGITTTNAVTLYCQPNSPDDYLILDIRTVNTKATDGFTFQLGNLLDALNIGNNIGYVITSSGREYYSANNDIYTPYEFTLTKQFINNTTKHWTSGQYSMSVEICSGELMTDWLIRNYVSLYGREYIPKSNAELAKYICKKNPSLLEGVNITEPLVSYTNSLVLDTPVKIIVKEA